MLVATLAKRLGIEALAARLLGRRDNRFIMKSIERKLWRRASTAEGDLEAMTGETHARACLLDHAAELRHALDELLKDAQVNRSRSQRTRSGARRACGCTAARLSRAARDLRPTGGVGRRATRRGRDAVARLLPRAARRAPPRPGGLGWGAGAAAPRPSSARWGSSAAGGWAWSTCACRWPICSSMRSCLRRASASCSAYLNGRASCSRAVAALARRLVALILQAAGEGGEFEEPEVRDHTPGFASTCLYGRGGGCQSAIVVPTVLITNASGNRVAR